MKKYLLLLVALSSFHTSACEIPIGNYDAITETEFSLTIKLIDPDTFHFIHKNWSAGDREVAEEHIYKGRYKCSGNSITLEYTADTITGIYQERSLRDDSFPFDGKAKVIDFTGTKYSKGLIAGWHYWPEQFLQETFK